MEEGGKVVEAAERPEIEDEEEGGEGVENMAFPQKEDKEGTSEPKSPAGGVGIFLYGGDVEEDGEESEEACDFVFSFRDPGDRYDARMDGPEECDDETGPLEASGTVEGEEKCGGGERVEDEVGGVVDDGVG